MKRDIDLARQLLMDIENRGADCSVSVLRSNPDQETEERIRYHLRLLIDAGMLKEVDRTSTGIPCLRLTHQGHELLELARHEGRWRDAKTVCFERIGGLSLSVIRQLLVRFALRPRAGRRYRSAELERRGEYVRYRPSSYYREGRYREDLYRDRPGYLSQRYHAEPWHAAPYQVEPYHVDSYRYDPSEGEAYAYDERGWWIDAETPIRGVDTRPAKSVYVEPRNGEPRTVRTRSEARNGRRYDGIDLDGDGVIDLEFEPSLPDYLL